MRLPFLVSCSLLFVVAGRLTGQADAAAGKLDVVRTAYAEMVKVREEMQTLMKEVRNVKKDSDEEKQLREKIGGMRQRLGGPQKAFADAFAAADWQKFDPKADAELLKDALPGLVREHKKPALAVAAGQFYLSHFGSERAADMIRSNALPMAMLAAGDVNGAKKMLSEAAAAAPDQAKARLLLTIGDLHAAEGDTATALAKYGEADALADDERTKGYVTLRKELVGKPAPEITSSQWIGAEAKPLSGLAGKVVLVDFWATWCGPCRAVMPALNEMFHEHRAAGLEVIGLTRFYKDGYMAANKDQMQTGGESVNGLTEATFPEHVATFKKNTGIDYPFVIGAEQNFKDYLVKGIPTLAVIGKDGKVAMMTVGSGGEALLQYAVKNLLAKKS